MTKLMPRSFGAYPTIQFGSRDRFYNQSYGNVYGPQPTAGFGPRYNPQLLSPPPFYATARQPVIIPVEVKPPSLATELQVAFNQLDDQYRYEQSLRKAERMRKLYWKQQQANRMPLPMYTQPSGAMFNNYGPGIRNPYEQEFFERPNTGYLRSRTLGYGIRPNLGFGTSSTLDLPPKIRVIFIPPGISSFQQQSMGPLSAPPFLFNRMAQPCCSLPPPPPLPQIGSLPVSPAIQQMVMERYANPIAVLPFTSNMQMPPMMMSAYAQQQLPMMSNFAPQQQLGLPLCASQQQPMMSAFGSQEQFSMPAFAPQQLSMVPSFAPQQQLSMPAFAPQQQLSIPAFGQQSMIPAFAPQQQLSIPYFGQQQQSMMPAFAPQQQPMMSSFAPQQQQFSMPAFAQQQPPMMPVFAPQQQEQFSMPPLAPQQQFSMPAFAQQQPPMMPVFAPQQQEQFSMPPLVPQQQFSMPAYPQQQQPMIPMTSFPSAPQFSIPPPTTYQSIQIPSAPPIFGSALSNSQHPDTNYPSTCRACPPAPPPLNISVTGHCWIQHCCACHQVPDSNVSNVRPAGGRATPLLRYPTVPQYVPDQTYQHQQDPHANAPVMMRPWLRKTPPLPPGAVLISDEYITGGNYGRHHHHRSRPKQVQSSHGSHYVERSNTQTTATATNTGSRSQSGSPHVRNTNNNNSNRNYKARPRWKSAVSTPTTSSSSSSENIEYHRTILNPEAIYRSSKKLKTSASSGDVKFRYIYQPREYNNVRQANTYLKSSSEDTVCTPIHLRTLLAKEYSQIPPAPLHMDSKSDKSDEISRRSLSITSPMVEKLKEKSIIIREFVTSSPSTVSTISSNESFNIIL